MVDAEEMHAKQAHYRLSAQLPKGEAVGLVDSELTYREEVLNGGTSCEMICLVANDEE